jgi:hypothetical protein
VHLQWECGVRFDTVLYDSNMMVKLQFENSTSQYMALAVCFYYVMEYYFVYVCVPDVSSNPSISASYSKIY